MVNIIFRTSFFTTHIVYDTHTVENSHGNQSLRPPAVLPANVKFVHWLYIGEPWISESIPHSNLEAFILVNAVQILSLSYPILTLLRTSYQCEWGIRFDEQNYVSLENGILGKHLMNVDISHGSEQKLGQLSR